MPAACMFTHPAVFAHGHMPFSEPLQVVGRHAPAATTAPFSTRQHQVLAASQSSPTAIDFRAASDLGPMFRRAPTGHSHEASRVDPGTPSMPLQCCNLLHTSQQSHSQTRPKATIGRLISPTLHKHTHTDFPNGNAGALQLQQSATGVVHVRAA
ncbi:hypothetical protein CC86DRAFT_129813 [Ophiobolus disseminans]|uniref:Uncharacterized protein n=1 Tax=Ophiobolus disseminans TaxID=1469910 RepID=A0A6A6ZEF1_9PLEO|nr:hypothetical protein CC86DRAFT_129813 [Ophiobolus disseminans]